MNRIPTTGIWMLVLTFCFAPATKTFLTAQVQEVDPFYTRTLDSGEALYIEQKYSEALKKFEIAAFGLIQADTHRIKALFFIGLCRHHLNDREACESNLRTALTLMGDRDLKEIEFSVGIKSEIETILAQYKLKEQPAAAPVTRSTSPAVSRMDPAQKLEAEIERNRRNPAPYYNLYSLHMNGGNTRSARNTLEDLILYNPKEARGHFLLGELHYLDRNFAKAQNLLERVPEMAEKQGIQADFIDESLAYLILIPFYQGKRDLSQNRAGRAIDRLENRLPVLSLSERDRQILQSIFAEYRRATPIRLNQQEVNRLESQIRKNPYDIQSYFDLFYVHRGIGNFNSARDTLRQLLRISPRSMNAQLLLVKLEHGARNFREAHKACRNILEAADQSNVTHEITVSTLIYAILCEFHLERLDNVRSLVDILLTVADEQEISNLVIADELEMEWERIKNLLRNKTPACHPPG